MTGEDDRAEHVLPVTIAVMDLLGHKVKKPLPKKTTLTKLFTRAAKVTFTKKVQAKKARPRPAPHHATLGNPAAQEAAPPSSSLTRKAPAASALPSPAVEHGGIITATSVQVTR